MQHGPRRDAERASRVAHARRRRLAADCRPVLLLLCAWMSRALEQKRKPYSSGKYTYFNCTPVLSRSNRRAVHPRLGGH